jgi:hypothetical protein
LLVDDIGKADNRRKRMKIFFKELGKIFQSITLAESGDFETARSILEESSLHRGAREIQGTISRASESPVELSNALPGNVRSE